MHGQQNTQNSTWMFTPNLAYVSEAPSKQGMGYVWLNTDYSESSCSHSHKSWNIVMGLPIVQTKISVIAQSNKHVDGHPWDAVCESPSYGMASGVNCTHLLQHMPRKLRRTICYTHLNGSHYCSVNGTMPNMLWHPPCPIFVQLFIELGRVHLLGTCEFTYFVQMLYMIPWMTYSPCTVPQLQHVQEYRKLILKESIFTMNAHTK